MMTYYMSLKPGHFKTYSTLADSFWCCVGTGLENHAKYGDTIYFHDTNSIYVNLFIASQLNWAERGLVVRQDTAFPETNTTQFSFTCTNPVSLTLRIRYPAWSQPGMTVTVNGTPQGVGGTPGSFVSITRTWQNGDLVQVQIPMGLRTEPLPDNTDPNTVALLYGPVLLAGELGTYGMPASDFAAGPGDLFGVAGRLVPVLVCDTNGLLSNTVPVPGPPLTFQSANVMQPYPATFIPFYTLHHQRYSVYWKLISPAGWQQQVAKLSAADARNVDLVQIGDPASESAHSLTSSNSNSGPFSGRYWRDAGNGGWFSYLLATLPDEPMTLNVTYWGSDNGARVFDILVNGQVIATQSLTNSLPGQFFDVQYPIPANLTSNQTQVTVRFQGHPGDTAGGIFGLQMMKTIDPGPLQSISITASSSQPLVGQASHQFPQVVANYQNLTNHPIAGSPNLVLLSSDTDVLTTGNNGDIVSVNPGTATITANYLGFTSQVSITVTSTPITYMKPVLRHRYQFKSANLVNASNVIDLVNPSNAALWAVLRGNAVANNQQLVLDGSTGTYVDLPAGIISNYNGVTVEAWASFGPGVTWSYLFAFGDTISGAGNNGFWFTPHSGFSDYRLILSEVTGQAEEYRIQQPGYLDDLSRQHIVAVLDLYRGYEALFVNGSLIGERSDVPFDQTAIHDVHNYIGRSAYSWDPFLNATVDEVRIYEGRMTTLEAAALHALGPGMVLGDVKLACNLGPGGFTISWPTNAAGFALQSSAATGPGAVWSAVTNVPMVVGNAFQLTLPFTNSARFFRLAR
jgi:hypothetical protein